VIGLCIFSAFYPPTTWKYYVSLPKVENRADGQLRVSFLDVGQGDATLVRLPDGKVVLIDGGNSYTESELSLMRYLNAAKVDKIDFVIATHADSDHCGALDVVVKYKDVGKVLLPRVPDVNINAEFAALYAQVVEKGCDVGYADRSFRIQSADSRYPYSMRCIYPSINYFPNEETNADSAVIILEYMGTEVLLCGDAPYATELKLMDDYNHNLLTLGNADLTDVEILKVAHHGSNTSTSTEFLQFLGVETAVISVGADNLYAHPSNEVIGRLTDLTINVHRTDEKGHIVAVLNNDGTYRMQYEG
jgi:competence protein ComEC